MTLASRALASGALAAAMLVACSFTRNLDYLTDGLGDSGAQRGDHDTGADPGAAPDDGGPTVGIVVASKQYAPANLVQDAENIYWTTDDNAVMKLAKGAGAPVLLTKIDGSAAQILQAVVDADPAGSVYLLLASGISKVPKAGGPPVPFVATTTAYEIAVDETSLYVLSAVDPDNADTAQLVSYLLTAPATPTTLSSIGTAPTSLRVTSDAVYWTVTDANSNYVALSLPKVPDGGPAAPTVHMNTSADQGSAIGIAPTDATSFLVDGTSFFWVDDTESAAYAMPLVPPTSTATTLITAANQNTFNAIAIDAQWVYLTPSGDTDSNQLIQVPRSGGKPTVTTVEANPTEIAVDDTAIYLAFNGPGTVANNGGIVKIAK